MIDCDHHISRLKHLRMGGFDGSGQIGPPGFVVIEMVTPTCGEPEASGRLDEVSGDLPIHSHSLVG